MRPLFQHSTATALKLIVLTAVSLGVMHIDHRYQHLQHLRAALAQLLYPVQVVVHLPTELLSLGSRNLRSHQQLVDQNLAISGENLLLRARLQRLEVLEDENARLRALLGASPKTGSRVLVAELLSVDLDPYRQQVIIDKGSRDDVYQGQPLIDAFGVMGQVQHVSYGSSTAILISDPSHSVPVQLSRTGLRTIARGTGKADVIELLFVPSNADIQAGDTVATSGLGGRFPPDYPVATISAVERPLGESFAQVLATPTAELDRSRQVLLVWGADQPDFADPDDG